MKLCFNRSSVPGWDALPESDRQELLKAAHKNHYKTGSSLMISLVTMVVLVIVVRTIFPSLTNPGRMILCVTLALLINFPLCLNSYIGRQLALRAANDNSSRPGGGEVRG